MPNEAKISEAKLVKEYVFCQRWERC